ncbi:DUF6392 family protein [Pseudomonas japonica]|uniref:DUF6392 family protein n=1 Tax=Pseudomonas japonica TaxID=256466 RepID=UPI0015E3CF37|nr:DUF6392 family protein [Pseudomonas japonica]MBA1241372.1 hypothetical protein [Pseudomonas japonica]MBA1287885.1 hypothetical protein [Pseudomonas japonica]
MKKSTLESLIEKMGEPLDSPLEGVDLNSLRKEKSGVESETYYKNPEPGLELSFLENSNILSSISLTLTALIPDEPIYVSELPLSLRKDMKRDDVIAELGHPLESGQPDDIPILGPSGGWDTFPYPGNDQIKIIAGYLPGLEVETFRFTKGQHI